MTNLVVQTDQTTGAPSFEQRVNLWLTKFSRTSTADAYADDLGIPHESRDWYTASAPDTPRRRGRKRGTLRRGVAFFPWCVEHGLDPMRTVGLDQLQQWLHDAADAGLAKTTRAHMLTAVREFYTAMQRQGALSTNPAELVDTAAAGLTGATEDDDQVFLDVHQTRQLLTLARGGSAARRGGQYRERDLAVLLVLCVTGARASEVTSLNVGDYRRANPTSAATLRLRGKGGKIRTAEVDAHVADDIDAWIQARADMLDRRTPVRAGQASAGEQPLFCTRTGRRLSPGYLGDIMRRVAAQDGSPLAGIADELHPHALRAAFVTTALDAGVPIEEVAAAVGHAHISTTLRYDRRRKRRRTGAFRAVSGLVAEDRAEPDQEAGLADRIASYDAQQLPGQTAVPIPGYDDDPEVEQ